MSNERTGVLELALGDSYIGSAYSPQVEVTDTDTGHEVAITYMSPEGIVTERFDVADGEQGPQGPAGFSPTVTITDTPTGHTVTITDAQGPHGYDVPNYAQEEQQRQDAWDELSGEVTDAITAAESATSAASTAATSATSAATSANTAAQAATTAASSATTAASSADAAATAANAAASAADTAADEATTAASAASSAAGDASDAADEARQIAEDIQEELDAKADTHGQYPSLSVGRADAFTGADETAQWAMRVTAGSGAATVRSVQGADVVWNQMAQNGDFANRDHWTKVSNYFNWIATDNTAVLTASDDGKAIGLASDVVALVDGHKYLASCYAKTSNANALYISLNSNSGTINGVAANVALSNAFQKVSGIVTYSPPSSGTNRVRIATSSGTTASGDVLTIANVQLFDLTAMFCAGNEPATVAEFEAMYPEAYYPYSAPTLKPVQIAGIASTDAQGNELDSVEWETQTLRAAGSVADMLYSDHVDVRVGVIDLGTLNWTHTEGTDFMVAVVSSLDFKASTRNLTTTVPNTGALTTSDAARLRIYGTGYTDAATFKAAMDGVYLFYELATPITTPISPALPMTYRVEQGGTESIIVPAGEVSAAPVLTIAEGESAADLVMDALACIATPDGPVATSSHAVNTYLTMGGKLYKVTSAIAVGETIKSGTNVTETTVMAELLALTA